MNNAPYRVLDCPDYKMINSELLDYVNKYTNLLTNDPHAPDYNPMNHPVYCNFPDKFGHSTIHFIKSNPSLINWCANMGMRLRDAYFTLAWSLTSEASSTCAPAEANESSCPIHIDKPPVYWKLNWPILNMEHTAIRFYELKDKTIDMQTLITRGGNPASKDRDHYNLKYKDFVEMDRHRFDSNPIIMNGMVPHDIGFYENPVFPRIGLQGMFFKEPIHLL